MVLPTTVVPRLSLTVPLQLARGAQTTLITTVRGGVTVRVGPVTTGAGVGVAVGVGVGVAVGVGVGTVGVGVAVAVGVGVTTGVVPPPPEPRAFAAFAFTVFRRAVLARLD